MSATVLIIDDDEIINEMISVLLQSHNYKTLSAHNGNEGLDILQNEEIDLVITDIIMPDKEGLQTIREIKSISPNTPIVAISGGGKHNADYLAMANLMGAIHTFRKPFNHDEFLSAIKDLLT